MLSGTDSLINLNAKYYYLIRTMISKFTLCIKKIELEQCLTAIYDSEGQDKSILQAFTDCPSTRT